MERPWFAEGGGQGCYEYDVLLQSSVPESNGAVTNAIDGDSYTNKYLELFRKPW
jgi:hypothetical protein